MRITFAYPDRSSKGQAPRYPTRASQGPATYSPASGDPTLAQPGQTLYDLDHHDAANFSPGQRIVGTGAGRRPFSLADTSHDFGLDPRAIAVGIMTATGVPYHQHVYHTGPDAAAFHIAYAVAAYHLPIVAVVNHGAHSVIVAGVWAIGNPAMDPHAQIVSFAVYDSWDQSWQRFLSGQYFARIPYATFAHASLAAGAWLGLPYASNSGLDPDPYMGIYQAGADPYTGPTANPNAHFWLGNVVTIEPDGHNDNNPNLAYNEADQLMTGP